MREHSVEISLHAWLNASYGVFCLPVQETLSSDICLTQHSRSRVLNVRLFKYIGNSDGIDVMECS